MKIKYCRAICAFYGAVLAVFSVLLFVMPKKSFSPTENRSLTQMSAPSFESLLDGSFKEGFSSFCADQFPFRNSFLTLSSSFDLCLGKLESNGVMKGKNQNLIKRLEYNDTSKLKENLAAIESIKNFAQQNGGKAVFFCAPRAVDVLESYAPPLFNGGRSDEIWGNLRGAQTITAFLKSKADNGEYVFYKTDHHWTTLGAYYAYCLLGNELGYQPFELSDFGQERVCEDFYGTTHSSSLFPNTHPDIITAFRFDGDDKISVTDVLTGKVSRLYDYSSLSKSSKYNFFLGGNSAHLKVESQKPRLVLIKDSFANALIPFLSIHYNVTAIDPRYADFSIKEYISSHNFDAILLLCGTDTLATDRSFARLGL